MKQQKNLTGGFGNFLSSFAYSTLFPCRVNFLIKKEINGEQGEENKIMIKFETVKEFNKAWNYFEEKYKRESIRMPNCETIMQHWPEYKNTSRFQWIVETNNLWKKFVEKEYPKIKDEIPQSYATKHLKFFVKEKPKTKQLKFL